LKAGEDKSSEGLFGALGLGQKVFYSFSLSLLLIFLLNTVLVPIPNCLPSCLDPDGNLPYLAIAAHWKLFEIDASILEGRKSYAVG